MNCLNDVASVPDLYHLLGVQPNEILATASNDALHDFSIQAGAFNQWFLVYIHRCYGLATVREYFRTYSHNATNNPFSHLARIRLHVPEERQHITTPMIF